MMDHNKLFGTMRALLNRPSWQAQEEQQFKRLIMSLSKTAPKIYQSVWQPYLQGQKQRWKHTVLTATSIEEVDLLYWSLPWVSWQYQLSPNYITPLSTSLGVTLYGGAGSGGQCGDLGGARPRLPSHAAAAADGPRGGDSPRRHGQ